MRHWLDSHGNGLDKKVTLKADNAPQPLRLYILAFQLLYHYRLKEFPNLYLRLRHVLLALGYVIPTARDSLAMHTHIRKIRGWIRDRTLPDTSLMEEGQPQQVRERSIS